MKHVFKPSGICPDLISFDIDGNKRVSGIAFKSGCDGNLKMLSMLLDGRSADEIIGLCKGNTCGRKKTSCADQLAIAVGRALESGQQPSGK